MAVELTADQKKAVASTTGDLAIAAGAGTGKTRVLAERFVKGLAGNAEESRRAVDVERVLTITFTVKAAGELGERARRAVAEEISVEASRGMDRAWISTIHGLCSRLLRRHPLEAGVEPGFALADELQASVLQAEAFEAVSSRLCLCASTADPDVAQLFETFPFESLASGVVSMHERARSMGLDPRQVEFPTGEEHLGALVSRAVRSAAELADACAECRQTDSVTKTGAIVSAYGEALSGCVLGSEDSCRELDSIVGSLEAMPSSRDLRVQALKAALLEVNDDLMRALGGIRETASLRGLRKILEAFSDEYAACKASRGLLDFEDLQESVVRLFQSHPDLAARYREHFRMIMVDEFQDTNDLQMRVLNYLRDSDFCVVGDERQSIYGFRNADVRIFGRLRSEIENRVELRDNFRSHSDVLGFVNAAFRHPALFGPDFLQLRAGRVEKPPLPVIAEKPRVRCLLVDKGKASIADGRAEEASRITEEVTRLIRGGVEAGDIAVLLRNSTNASLYASAIEEAGHAVYVSAGERFFESQEVDEILSLLRVVALPSDDEALIRVLSGRFVRASSDALFALRDAAGPRGHLFDALRNLASAPRFDDLPEADCALLRTAYSRLQLLREAQSRLGLGELIQTACEAFDYDLVLFSMGPPSVRAWANVQKLIGFAEEYEEVESSSLGAFVDHLRLRAAEAGRESMASVGSGKEVVQIMTIHASKGLEFPVVIAADLGVQTTRGPGSFLLGVREGDADKEFTERVLVGGVKFPDVSEKQKQPTETLEHRRLAEEAKEGEVEEQKRCLYVACTRAREALLLTGTCNLEKEPGDGHLVDWVRAVLGNPQESGTIELGGGDSGEGGLDSLEVGLEVVWLQEGGGEGEGEEEGAAERTAEEQAVDAQDARDAANAEEGAPAGDALAEPPVPPRLAAAVGIGQTSAPYTPSTVSYTQLHQFDTCPFSYYVRSVLGFRTVTLESAATNFGSAVHALLQHASSQGIAEDAIEATVRRYDLDAAGRDRLTATVNGFLGGEIAKRAYAGQRIERECPVRVPLGRTHLIGSIDLLSWSGEKALIIDYKTGEAPGADSPRLPGYRLQASCYALATLKAGAEEVEVVFAFLEHGAENLTFRFDCGDLPALEDAIRARIARIESSEFPHLESYSAEVCWNCPALGGLCPVRPVGDAARRPKSV